ncbi:MAG: EAL domain-containing protein [Cyanobacteria bacterium P01_H01_bin.15]
MSFPDATGAKILIIDDSQTNTDLLTRLLLADKFQVKTAQNGEAGLAEVALDTPELILLDVLMPGINGFETCARLKAYGEWASIPVIFMTALNDAVDRLRGLELGAVDYIIKPFEPAEVLARVRLHLGLSRITQALQSEVDQRIQAESKLQLLNRDLENRVNQRTGSLNQTLQQLAQANAQLEEQKKELEFQATHDSLTGLPNRMWFQQRLQELIAQAKQQPGYCFAVLFIDLDRFKVINDSLGHIVGDRLLHAVATRISKCLRITDSVSRLGGDEFVVLVDDTSSQRQACAVAEGIIDDLRKPFDIKHYQLNIEASIGIALSNENHLTADDILRDADVATYHAKKSKQRENCAFLTPEMRQASLLRLELETQLRQGLERQEFSLRYQPIVSLKTGATLGFEALLRWEHPQRGLIHPKEFIPIAEETGLIQTLGWWAVEKGAQQLCRWLDSFPQFPDLFLTVNLSPQQLLSARFSAQIAELFKKYQLRPEQLRLEITESSFLEPDSPGADNLRKLKSLGCWLCLDDFGTGYSALSRLHEFPMKTLKIDKSFVWQLEDPKKTPIVRTIVALAHNLNMDVVAEGIETNTQYHKLNMMGCEMGQGYLFSYPITAEDVASHLLISGQPSFPQNNVVVSS